MSSSDPTYVDLEIRILGREGGGYPVELTLEGDRQFPRGHLAADFLPWVPSADEVADGERLFRALFADPDLAVAWFESRGTRPLRRLRLRIDPQAAELHVIPWELLREPATQQLTEEQPSALLAASTATPFSRYLAGRWRPGSPVIQRPLKILVAIADPDNLDEYQLQRIDVDAEWDSLQSALAGLDAQLTRFPDRPPAGAPAAHCALPELEAELRKGYHGLHLICHGGYSRSAGKASLFLSDESGHVRRVEDDEFAEMLARLLDNDAQRTEDKLRLVFLASCQTATRSPADAFRGLAPKLVAAGAPAVVAMQDAIPVDTAREFSRTFYHQLLESGQVDLAANQARSTLVSARLSGAAIPVLFMRLRDGRLLSQKGQILGDRADSVWSVLLGKIVAGKCTPVLGPGVTVDLLPSPTDMARQLAAKYNYPFLATQSLPRVAQFIASIDTEELRSEVVRLQVEGFGRRMKATGPPANPRANLSQAVRESGWPAACRELFESEIHGQLADLGLPLYVTTNSDNFMALALESRLGRPARREGVAWREVLSPDAARPHHDLNPPATPENPVVLHLFGTDEDLCSLVLTEDDYLDYLAHISRDYEYLLPTSVNAALASTTLLFLGFRLDDLDLKVILRGLLANLDLRRWRVLRVAVQIEAEVVDQTRLDEVTSYFQRYFRESEIQVYWGSVRQFVSELHARWQEYPHG